ncbi:MAG: VOC family protein [Gammaproteobacteria bacterium]
MEQQLGQVVLVVSDYDEAIAYFTTVLNFDLVEDAPQGSKRWVIVRPKGSGATSLLLAKAKNETEQSRVGNQTGGRVAFFLYTDDFWRDYNSMKAKGVDFIKEPRDEDYGYVIVFRDLYGNKWDFIQPHNHDKKGSPNE